MPIEFGPVELIDWRTVYYPWWILKKETLYINKKKVAESLKKKGGFDLWMWIWDSSRHFFGKNLGPNPLAQGFSSELWAFWHIVCLKQTTVAKVMTIWSLHVICAIYVFCLLCNWVVSLTLCFFYLLLSLLVCYPSLLSSLLVCYPICYSIIKFSFLFYYLCASNLIHPGT